MENLKVIQKKRNIFEASPLSSSEIYPGSIIFVPRKLDRAHQEDLQLKPMFLFWVT